MPIRNKVFWSNGAETAVPALLCLRRACLPPYLACEDLDAIASIMFCSIKRLVGRGDQDLRGWQVFAQLRQADR